jgi:dihydropyrimidinase
LAEVHDVVIRDGWIVTPEEIVTGDLAVRDDKIDVVGNVSGKGRREISAAGKWVMPGGVDPHAHIEQLSGMGLMNADTFGTATRSAAMGGTTSVICFAAQQKGERLVDTVNAYARRALRGAMIDYAFHVTISDTSVPSFEVDLGKLISEGHRSLKVFTTYDIRLDDCQILSIMAAAQEHGALVCVHAENDAIISRSREQLLKSGKISARYHARSRPRMAEIEAVERICRFAEYLNQPVMLFHISTKEAVEVVGAARKRGVPVWAETCPHYLFMTADVLDRPDGAKWMCSPPQREPADQAALFGALEKGDLQIVSSDHAPYRYDETGKLAAGPDAGFHQIANGLPGLETRLPLMFDEMVSRKKDPMAFVRLTSSAPAEIYGLASKGILRTGKDADVVIWDPERSVTYGADDLHDNVGYNPWEGRTVKGWPETVILRGNILLEGGQFVGKPGKGRWLTRASPDRPVSGA